MAFGTERDSQLVRLLDELRAEDLDTDTAADSADAWPADDPTEPAAGPASGLSGHRYQLVRKLGEGGMGEVFEGYDPQLDRPVAIKFPLFDPARPHHKDRVRRFLREANAAARVRHGNVCPIYDVGEADGRPFVVMALVRGESLAARLAARGGPFGPTEAVRVVRQVAAGLVAVHQHVIHRDIKPGNILLDAATGDAVLTDFGLARPAEDDEDRLTAEGTIAGTPAYMAPEQAAGEDDRLGPPTDVYGLGVVLFELLTGQVPFAGNRLSVLKQVINNAPPKPSSLRRDLDPGLEAIVLKAMAKSAADRYATAGQFADALGAWRADGETVTAEGPASTRRRRRPRRYVAAILGSAVVLLAGFLSAYAGGLFRPQPPSGAGALAGPGPVAEALPLDGELVVTVSSNREKGPVTKRMIPVDERGALPVRDGELIYLHIKLNQPAYAYVLWVDAAGTVAPLYPWEFENPEILNAKTLWEAPLRAEAGRSRQEFHLPALDHNGFVTEGPAGLETAILLARKRPFRDVNQLRDLVGKLPPSPMMHPEEVVWIGRGPADRDVRWERDLNRGLKPGQAEKLDAPLVDVLRSGVGKHFELLKAVRFAHKAGPPEVDQ